MRATQAEMLSSYSRARVPLTIRCHGLVAWNTRKGVLLEPLFLTRTTPYLVPGPVGRLQQNQGSVDFSSPASVCNRHHGAWVEFHIPLVSMKSTFDLH